MSVLIVEGASGIGRLLGDRLLNQGVRPTVVGSVASAFAVVEQQSFTVAILDMALPDGSGLDVLDRLRQDRSAAHVVVLSKSLDGDERVGALERGADDYFVEPFHVRELAERVLAARRRNDTEKDAFLQVGPLAIDLRARLVRIEGQPLKLTGKEFDLLAYLAARPGLVFSRDELLGAVWQSASEWQQSATVTEHIGRLRAKIETDRRRPRILRTVRGAGYRLDLPRNDANTDDRGSSFAPGTLIHIDGRIVWADGAAGMLLGLANEGDLLGRQISELAGPASKDAIHERIIITGPVDVLHTQLFDLVRSDGAEVLVEVASERIDWNGQQAGRISVTQVPNRSDWLRRLVTGVVSELTESVIITDLHFHVRSLNKAAERLYGWREQEVLGRHVLDVLQVSVDDSVLTAILDDLKATGQWKSEGRHVTRDGSVISVRANTTLVYGDSGEPVLIVSVIRPHTASTASHEPAGGYDYDQYRTALDNDEFEVYYQPIVALVDLRVVAMEALVRWNHPERGLLTPASFIDAAEHSGSIIELGLAVLEKACGQASEWRQAGFDIEISVNLSARQLNDPELYDRISKVLTFTDLKPSKLCLEVTETALVEDIDQAKDVLDRLTDLGVRITIDDFGTGWASLTYLKKFPISALKIDRSFVAGVGRKTHDTAIARSILALGAELGLAVVAEGVETEAQQKALQKLGCTIAQGFLYGQPTSPSTAPIRRARRIET
jgi:PAS domain S-box-containing protein